MMNKTNAQAGRYSAVRHRYLLLGVAALFITLASGCKHSKKASDSADAAATKAANELMQAVPDDFEIIVGQTGVGSGRMTGYTIAANGVVTKWVGKYPKANTRQETETNLERAAAMWRHTVDSGIMDTYEQAKGNATWFVTVTAGGEGRSASWTESPETLAEPNKAQQFYNSCIREAKKALGES